MRPRTTNTKRQAFDAYKLSFESAGALGLQTNTQGPPRMAPYIAFALCPHSHVHASHFSTSGGEL
jgi:hypothetical protein